MSEASGCSSASPTTSINVSSMDTRRSYSRSVWGTNRSGAMVGHTCSTISISLVVIALFLPLSCVIFLVGQDGANVDLLSVVMNSCDEPGRIPTDIEDRQLPNLIGTWKEGA